MFLKEIFCPKLRPKKSLLEFLGKKFARGEDQKKVFVCKILPRSFIYLAHKSFRLAKMAMDSKRSGTPGLAQSENIFLFF